VKFIIYAPSYDENIGGIIVLHQLCHELNMLGEEAYLWQKGEPPLDWSKPIRSLYRLVKYNYILNNKYDKNFQTREGWKTPIAGFLDIKDAVVVYPEIISDNPLKSKKVVRWFLNKPSVISGKPIKYGKNELYFYYAQAFNDGEINPDSDSQLTLVTVMDDIYKQTNFGKRHGSCYMIRKGKGKEIVHDIEDSIKLDGLPHKEIADIFNQTEQFISYDLYTMYSNYAAMCGCTSIVVPDSHISEEEWRGSHGNKKDGMAYGFEKNQIEYAKNTQKKLIEELIKVKTDQKEMLINFVTKCVKHFYQKDV